jgi:site-specific DNA-methyltransferase (adenine-specific)/modification methylase
MAKMGMSYKDILATDNNGFVSRVGGYKHLTTKRKEDNFMAVTLEDREMMVKEAERKEAERTEIAIQTGFIKMGDSRLLIKNLPDKSIDLILTDPPYNLSGYSTGNMELSWRKTINNDLAEWDMNSFDPKEWLSEFKRVLKPTGNIFAFTSYNLLGKWHEVFDPEFTTFQYMVWHKTNPVPKIRRAGFLNSCELIICVWDKGHTWNFTKQNDMHNFIQTPICMGNERLKNPGHPTQKPVKILEHIIRIASNEGDIVLDPFMGVGSTGVAAANLKRKFIGFELEKEYFELAEKRLNTQSKLI